MTELEDLEPIDGRLRIVTSATPNPVGEWSGGAGSCLEHLWSDTGSWVHRRLDAIARASRLARGSGRWSVIWAVGGRCLSMDYERAHPAENDGILVYWARNITGDWTGPTFP